MALNFDAAGLDRNSRWTSSWVFSNRMRGHSIRRGPFTSVEQRVQRLRTLSLRSIDSLTARIRTRRVPQRRIPVKERFRPLH